MTERCTRETLAEAPGFRVERCTCGTFHVSAGAVTLRLERGALEAFAHVLQHALVEADRRAQKRPSWPVFGTSVIEA